MFVDRKDELDAMERMCRSSDPHLLVIYGKRRVGKTELIKQFIKGKPHVYYLGDRRPDREQIDDLSHALGNYFNEKFLRLPDWNALFEYLEKKSEKRLIVVIDEFPFLVEGNEAISSLFQKGWDEHLQGSKIFLILCGSSIGMMERETLMYRSPLYGRRTGQLLVQPLRFKDMREYFPSVDLRRLVEFYAVLGGIPSYWRQFSAKKDTMANISENILNKERILYHEVEFILNEELRQPRNYFSVIRSISFGNTKLNDIIQQTGLDKGMVSKYLSVLEELHIVTREVPVTEKNPQRSRMGIYRIEDSFFNFWFRFIFPNKGYIEEGQFKEVLKTKISPNFNDFVGHAFEDICKEVLWEMTRTGDLPFNPSKIGRWWYKENEIDLAALREDGRDILFVECKWKTQPVRDGDVKGLMAKASLVQWDPKDRKEHFAIFSKAGFSKECLEFCRQNRVLTFDMNAIARAIQGRRNDRRK